MTKFTLEQTEISLQLSFTQSKERKEHVVTVLAPTGGSCTKKCCWNWQQCATNFGMRGKKAIFEADRNSSGKHHCRSFHPNFTKPQTFQMSAEHFYGSMWIFPQLTLGKTRENLMKANKMWFLCTDWQACVSAKRFYVTAHQQDHIFD